jgi:multidrug transporter EmrE-like cation transporter
MDPFVFAAVLFAAACHAGWNAAIKGGNDTVSTTSLIAIGAGAVAFVILPFVGLPLPPAWPWVIASVVIHLLYFIGLSESYRVGDLGQVYPIARGTAPLMTAALSAPLIGEALGLVAWIGIAALAGGVLLLSARGGRELARFDRHATVCRCLLERAVAIPHRARHRTTSSRWSSTTRTRSSAAWSASSKRSGRAKGSSRSTRLDPAGMALLVVA